jgi:hypothetical protein
LTCLFLLCSCTENSLPQDDLGSFYTAKDTGQDLLAMLEYPKVEGFVFEIEEPYVVLAGLTRELTVQNPDPGEPLPHVSVSVFDMAQTLLAVTESDDSGAYVLAFHLSNPHVDGYVEAKKEGFLTVRQFDRPISESWTNMRLRLVKEDSLLSLSFAVLQQDEALGYVQGSIYDKFSEQPVAGVRIVASSGEVAYLSDSLSLPDKSLHETQSRGVFFVANCNPGPLTIQAFIGSDKIMERSVLTWPGRVITQVGLPIVQDEKP